MPVSAYQLPLTNAQGATSAAVYPHAGICCCLPLSCCLLLATLLYNACCTTQRRSLLLTATALYCCSFVQVCASVCCCLPPSCCHLSAVQPSEDQTGLFEAAGGVQETCTSTTEGHWQLEGCTDCAGAMLAVALSSCVCYEWGLKLLVVDQRPVPAQLRALAVGGLC